MTDFTRNASIQLEKDLKQLSDQHAEKVDELKSRYLSAVKPLAAPRKQTS